MWLVPHTRASSDGVDVLDSEEGIHLKRGVDHRGCGPIGLCGYCIMLCDGVRPPSGESERARNQGWSQGRPVAMCLDSLRLPSCARNPHVKTQYAAEVLGLEFWIYFSLEGYVFVCCFP
ncbi:hypothetical protein M9H77_17669 [Catharanthus roseus]|uniref:Uncharacterized protein n=1 Tax=Catharanthus roseus TaxID=4058 RepID=A0ACC0B588_CATRO|nr:hypothetical protein M9H77_17669 [Catharanthus roseus]